MSATPSFDDARAVFAAGEALFQNALDDMFVKLWQ